jgi:hypothetical protein
MFGSEAVPDPATNKVRANRKPEILTRPTMALDCYPSLLPDAKTSCLSAKWRFYQER